MRTQKYSEEIEELSAYTKGFADALQNEKLAKAAEWLDSLSRHICGAGVIGCSGGPECDSDHK